MRPSVHFLVHGRALQGSSGHDYDYYSVQFSSVQPLTHVQVFATPWTARRITNSRCLLKLMSIELAMPSSQLILSHPLLFLPSIFPRIRVFPMSWLFALGGQYIGVSASTSVLPMNIQDWFLLGWTGWISLQSKDSQEPSPTPQFKSTNVLALSFLYSPTFTDIHD